MARIVEGSKPDYIKNLKPTHRLMAMKTAYSGYQPAQLSEAFGYSLRQITRIINSDAFRAYESILMDKADDALLTAMINDIRVARCKRSKRSKNSNRFF